MAAGRLVPTPRGDARVEVDRPAGAPVGLLAVGHGAGGGVEAPDLVAVRNAALAVGWAVARIEQPYRVAGRRSPAPAPALDEAWIATVAWLRGGRSARSAGAVARRGGGVRDAATARAAERGSVDDRAARRPPGLARLPLVVGGRSSGARVACRTAAATGAVGVLALAFPVHPPGRPDQSRLPELALPTVPVFVVQGDRDPFGMPPNGRGRTVHVVPGGDHSLRTGRAAFAAAVAAWLAGLVPATTPR